MMRIETSPNALELSEGLGRCSTAAISNQPPKPIIRRHLLSKALDDKIELTFTELSAVIHAQIEEEFFPFTWDALVPGQRRSVLAQIDALYDKDFDEARKEWFDHFLAMDELQDETERLASANSPTVLDIVERDKRLAEYKRQLSHMARSEKPVLKLDKGLDKWPAMVSTNCDHAASVFRSMKGLRSAELSITLVGESPSQHKHNGLIEVRARGETRRLEWASLGLIDLRSGHLNKHGVTLMGLAEGRKIRSKGPTMRTTMTRLRKVIKQQLGVSDDPFLPYNDRDGWRPRFELKDRRGLADWRAKEKAERKTLSFDHMADSNHQFVAPEPTNSSDDILELTAGVRTIWADSETEGDEADLWLKANDPTYRNNSTYPKTQKTSGFCASEITCNA